MVYIREAHPLDGWSVPGWSEVKDAKVLSERKETADVCRSALKFDFPAVIDGMNDAVARRWSGWPERLFVVSKDGRVVYTGDQGPFGFNPGAGYGGFRKRSAGVSLEAFLKAYLGSE